MTNEQAIELINQSDLPEEDKQKLTERIRTEGWTPAVQQAAKEAVANAKQGLQSRLDEVTAKTKAFEEQDAKAVSELRAETEQKMDEAVAEYEDGLGKLEAEASQVAEQAKQANE